MLISYFDGWLFAIICDNFMCMDDYLRAYCWLFGEDLKKIIEIYVNVCEFIGNKWWFKNKKCFYYYWVVKVTTEVGLKSQNGQFKDFEFINFRAPKK